MQHSICSCNSVYKILIFFSFTFFYKSALPQKTLVLKPEKIIIPDRSFYISGIIDERPDTNSIGHTASKEKVNFENNTSAYLLDYFNKVLPQEYKKQQPVILKIKKLQIKEENQYSEIATVSVLIDFYVSVSGSLIKVFESKSEINESGLGIAASHEKRIRFVFFDCLKQFSDSDWKSKKSNSGTNGNETFTNPPSKTKNQEESNDIEQLKPKNIKAIGVFLGGLGIIGYEYEWRVHNYIGISLGFGFIGATAGIKIHTKPVKDSHFFNISFKDRGAGLLDVVAVEWGGRWVFRKGKKLGLLYQVGYAMIVYIDAEYKQTLVGDKNIYGSLVGGLGLSW